MTGFNNEFGNLIGHTYHIGFLETHPIDDLPKVRNKEDDAMHMKMVAVVAGVLMIISGTGNCLAEPPGGEPSSAYGHGDDLQLPNGVIGVIIQVSAERIGESAALYILKIRQDGPAQQAGLRHGDEIVAVNGTRVKGKSYEEVASLIRGEPGSPVKLEVRGTREFSITRVGGDKFKTEGRSGPREGQSEKGRQ